MESPLPFRSYHATAPRSPVVISVPHAGRDYPRDCAPLCRVPLSQLVRLEDRYADHLVEPCIEAGYCVIIAQTPRLWIDLNRAEDDLAVRPHVRNSATSVSAKARSGLGLIPTRLSGVAEIWRSPPNTAAITQRITQTHRPYHEAISHALASAHRRFGVAVLLDIHSMPPLVGPDMPTFVIGDRFGRSAGMEYSDGACSVFTAAGFRVALNTPYAGAYILERHGRPDVGIHALQVEVSRRCYLDAGMNLPGDGLGMVQRLILNLAATFAESGATRDVPIAAE